MKKILACSIIILFLVVAMAASVFADPDFNVETFGGYAIVNMSSLNNNIDLIHKNAIADSSVSYVSAQQYVENGWFIGIDGGYCLLPGLSIGPRVEYLSTFPAQMIIDSTKLYGTTTTRATADITATLIPIEAGITYLYQIPGTKLSISAEVYGGYGFGSLTIDTLMETGYVSANTDETFKGNCFVFDSGLKLAYSFNSLFSTGLNIGYKSANVTKLQYTDVGLSLPSNSDYGRDLKLDFSGLNFKISLDFSI
jgi:hypothetical protein